MHEAKATSPRKYSIDLKAFSCGVLMMLAATLGYALDTDRPNDQLPRHIKRPRGKVSLFADYSVRQSDGSVPVYLINANKKRIILEAQVGDVFLKLEIADNNGHWIRAQPHAFSFCGNAYTDSPQVRPGHFLKIDGYQPKEGEKRNIRFSLYEQQFALSSNAGEGFAAAQDIDLASRDAMAVQEGTFEFVSKVALGEKKLVNELDHMKDLQRVAIRTLASRRFDSTKSRKVLSQVLARFPERKDEVADALRQLDETANRERRR